MGRPFSRPSEGARRPFRARISDHVRGILCDVQRRHGLASMSDSVDLLARMYDRIGDDTPDPSRTETVDEWLDALAEWSAGE